MENSEKIVTRTACDGAAQAQHGLVLSLFPGIDLLGRGFEAAGWCVVRGPDLITGGDVRHFHAPAGRFDGIIGGPPCQDFSRARRTEPTGYGREMLDEFIRVVIEAAPMWWLAENVPGVPDIVVPGYSHFRIDLDARDFGSQQRRLRHVQFGALDGRIPIVTRRPRIDSGSSQKCCMASEGNHIDRRDFGQFCELQGLSRDFELPGMTVSGRYRAVGNGVHVGVATALGKAVADAQYGVNVEICKCGCGRVVSGRRTLATAACRQRHSRKKRAK